MTGIFVRWIGDATTTNCDEGRDVSIVVAPNEVVFVSEGCASRLLSEDSRWVVERPAAEKQAASPKKNAK